MTKAVLFDFYGTLARAVAWGVPLEDVLGQRGLSMDPDAWARWEAEGADGIDHAEHSADRDRYVAWELARLRRLASGCGAPQCDLDVVAGELYTAMKTYTLEAYDEVPDVLRQVRAAGVTVAVCSNWDWDLERAMERSGLGGLTDVIVTSAQAGARKPHPRIYQHTLERCGGVAPSDALFVGDSWGPDVEGPRAAGLRAVHIVREGNGQGQGLVTDLRGVLDYL